MGTEAATHIADLNPALPPGTDPINQGDDHLRLLKAVLQRTFPNLSARLLEPHTRSGNYTASISDNFRSLIFTAQATLTLPDINTLEGVFVLFVGARADVVVQPAVGTINGLSGTTLVNGSFGFIVGGNGAYNMLVGSSAISAFGRTLDTVADAGMLKSLLFPSSGLIGDADIAPNTLSTALQNTGVTAGTYNTPSSLQINSKGQVVAVAGLKSFVSDYGSIESRAYSTGLSEALSVVAVDFSCLIADGGWAVNDNITFGGSSIGYTNNTQNDPMTSATRHGFVVNNKPGSLELRFASGGLYFFTPAGGYFKVTESRWNVRVRGYVF